MKNGYQVFEILRAGSIDSIIESRENVGQLLAKKIFEADRAIDSWLEFLDRKELIGVRDNFIICCSAHEEYQRLRKTEGEK